MSPLGEFTYYRTYSRWLPDKMRRERWDETVERVVNFSASLGPMEEGEAETLYDNIFHGRQFPAGRSLWLGGSEAGWAFPLGQYNCASVVMNRYPDAFAELAYALLVGTGVGFRVLPEDVEHFPAVHGLTLEAVYDPRPPDGREEHTHAWQADHTLYMHVGDSKEGRDSCSH